MPQEGNHYYIGIFQGKRKKQAGQNELGKQNASNFEIASQWTQHTNPSSNMTAGI